MPIGTPFHDRTREYCTSLFYKDWGGYYTVKSYGTCHESEYFTLRHAAALIDVSPLFKYEVTGPDAGRFLSRVMVKEVASLKLGRVTYLCWCDDHGKMIDDGTVHRLGETHFRVTAAEPSYSWFVRQAAGFDVQIEDVSDAMGALAVQGPRAREVLVGCVDGPVATLRFFGVMQGAIAGAPVWISRTGYTGDLGYEVWVAREHAIAVYDAILEAGQPHRAAPVGLDAMDVARVEAGFIMNGVDYWSAHHSLVESHKSSPFELGLDWCVQLDRDRFVGQAALRAEKAAGSEYALVGLIVEWDSYQRLFEDVGLPPSVPSGTQRDAVPIYGPGGRQVGYATSRAWSPYLKKYLAIGQVESAFSATGTQLQIEVTPDWQRQRAGARVTETPFFKPARARSK